MNKQSSVGKLMLGIWVCTLLSGVVYAFPSTSEKLPYIFESGTEGYRCFRIPAIVKTQKGTLLAFAEGRKNNCSDEEDIDLVLKRSTDQGKTWSKLMIVWSDAENTCGNPSPVVDQQTGKVHLLMNWNLGEDDIGKISRGTSSDTRRVYYTASTDDGLSWENPREITESVKKPEWGWYATGPVHGIQLQQGQYQGRLLIPCDYIETGPDRKGYSHVIWSDDGGANWVLGGVTPQPGVNESTVAERLDGSLLLNMRSHEGVRMVATSDDGGATWTNMQGDSQLVEPTCQGSLLSIQAAGESGLLFSNPASQKRERLTLKMSTDGGEYWEKEYEVHQGPSAYSDIVQLTEKTVGVLYEGGQKRPYEGIAFEIIPLEKLN
ncbi:MAG: sialidase family protein [Cyclobacteriaceae bacterium]